MEWSPSSPTGFRSYVDTIRKSFHGTPKFFHDRFYDALQLHENLKWNNFQIRISIAIEPTGVKFEEVTLEALGEGFGEGSIKEAHYVFAFEACTGDTKAQFELRCDWELDNHTYMSIKPEEGGSGRVGTGPPGVPREDPWQGAQKIADALSDPGQVKGVTWVLPDPIPD